MQIHKRKINAVESCYLIAEISHNHQGQVDKMLDLVKSAAENGADAVKFQKRDNENLFLSEYYNMPYSSENSFGKTYGEHRSFLEPEINSLRLAAALAHEMNIHFIMTVFDEASLQLCEEKLEVDAYKIQSADLTNHFLISQVHKTNKPFFISCGGASLNEIKETYEFCLSKGKEFCLMYAVSEYPTTVKHVNLRRINHLKSVLNTGMIGFSCHYPGLQPAILARTIGVVAIEKHFTLDRNQKGPDHKISILPAEMKELKERLSQVDDFLGEPWSDEELIEDYQKDARYKMGKCAIIKHDLPKGHILKPEDLLFKSPMKGSSLLKVKKLLYEPISMPLGTGSILT